VTRNWFAVKTKPRREQQARDVLIDRGIEVYLPCIPAIRRSSRHGVRLEPLFPSYMFARLALGTPEWIVARSAPNIAHFLGAGADPTPVSDELVDQIRARVEGLLPKARVSPFAAGDVVRIEDGPFVGLEAIFDRTLSPSGRVRVLLELLHRCIPVEIDCQMLNQQPVRRAS
jgi:transcriptional antiterminator RfaH